MAWGFYNSSGQELGDSDGSWKFYNSSGDALSTGSGSSDCGTCDLLTSGGADPELIFADGNVIWI